MWIILPLWLGGGALALLKSSLAMRLKGRYEELRQLPVSLTWPSIVAHLATPLLLFHSVVVCTLAMFGGFAASLILVSVVGMIIVPAVGLERLLRFLWLVEIVAFICTTTALWFAWRSRFP